MDNGEWEDPHVNSFARRCSNSSSSRWRGKTAFMSAHTNWHLHTAALCRSYSHSKGSPSGISSEGKSKSKMKLVFLGRN